MDFSAGTPCGALVACTNVTATIKGTLVVGCTTGLSFTDNTGAYNAATNTTGYGGPNTPALAAITGTQFQLYDSTGSTLIGTFNSSYIPEATGTIGVTLTPANFGLTVFAPGTTYVLTYGVIWTGPTTSVCLINSFTYPCCGTPIPSNLMVNFSTTEQIGNGAIAFADTTGAYDAVTNPGGYGAPNAAYGDITSTLITVTLEDGTVINFGTFKPTSPTSNSFTITAAMLGYSSGIIPDQIIQVTYTVYTGATCAIGYNNKYQLLYGVAANCRNNNTKGLLNGTMCCNDNGCDQTDFMIKMWYELDWIILQSTGNIGCIQGKIQAYNKKYCNSCCLTCG